MMRSLVGKGRVVWAAGLLVVLAVPLHAATPRDELLRFVPDDVGFCLVLQDLRGHTAALASSPFAEQFRTSAVGAGLIKSREAGQLDKVEKELKKHLGIDLATLRDDVLGDAVVFAFRPGPAGKMEQDRGLFLVRARNGRVLADLVKRFNKLQKESGELKGVEERTHGGVKYVRRDEAKGATYYHLRGPVLVFSDNEDMLHKALDRDRTAAAGAEPPVARRLRELGADKSLLAVWLNPRAYDAAVDAKVAEARAGNPALKTFFGYWKALDSVGLRVDVGRDLAVSVALRGRPDDLPASARRFFAEASRPSEVWRRFPENALLAVGGRIDAASLFAMIAEFLPRDARDMLRKGLNRTLGAPLGKDFIKDILPAVGPDWGLCIVAPPSSEPSWVPQAVLAVRVSPGPAAAPVDQALLTALDFSARLFILAHNSQHPELPLSLKPVVIDKREVKQLVGERALPPGVKPTFGLQNGYLILASSLDLFRRFSGPPAGAAAGPGVAPLLRISFKDLRAYLKDRRTALEPVLAEKHRLSREEAGKRLERFLAGIQFIDRLEVRQITTPNQVTFTLALQPSAPLKK